MAVYVLADVMVNDDSWLPEYAPYGAARIAGTRRTLEVIDDTDAAGTIPYLAKGRQASV